MHIGSGMGKLGGWLTRLVFPISAIHPRWASTLPAKEQKTFSKPRTAANFVSDRLEVPTSLAAKLCKIHPDIQTLASQDPHRFDAKLQFLRGCGFTLPEIVENVGILLRDDSNVERSVSELKEIGIQEDFICADLVERNLSTRVLEGTAERLVLPRLPFRANATWLAHELSVDLGTFYQLATPWLAKLSLVNQSQLSKARFLADNGCSNEALVSNFGHWAKTSLSSFRIRLDNLHRLHAYGQLEHPRSIVSEKFFYKRDLDFVHELFLRTGRYKFPGLSERYEERIQVVAKMLEVDPKLVADYVRCNAVNQIIIRSPSAFIEFTQVLASAGVSGIDVLDYTWLLKKNIPKLKMAMESFKAIHGLKVLEKEHLVELHSLLVSSRSSPSFYVNTSSSTVYLCSLGFKHELKETRGLLAKVPVDVIRTTLVDKMADLNADDIKRMSSQERKRTFNLLWYYADKSMIRDS